jgi:hypothetical protein
VFLFKVLQLISCFVLTIFKEGAGKCLQQELLHCLLQLGRYSQNGVTMCYI